MVAGFNMLTRKQLQRAKAKWLANYFGLPSPETRDKRKNLSRITTEFNKWNKSIGCDIFNDRAQYFKRK